jgi:hypothetical protein
MLKHTDGLTTLDQELFPGLREEDDKKHWRLQKWAFVITLALVLVLCSGKLWLTSRRQATDLADQASPQDVAKNHSAMQTTQASWLDEWETTISRTFTASKAIPKGTLIPVEIESAQPGRSGRARVLARTKSYVFADKTVMIPPGSEVQGIAQRYGDKWEIHWNSVSVLSVGGRQAEIQAMSEIPGKASLYGRSLLVKAK